MNVLFSSSGVLAPSLVAANNFTEPSQTSYASLIQPITDTVRFAASPETKIKPGVLDGEVQESAYHDTMHRLQNLFNAEADNQALIDFLLTHAEQVGEHSSPVIVPKDDRERAYLNLLQTTYGLISADGRIDLDAAVVIRSRVVQDPKNKKLLLLGN
ncbi:MAG: hypothetical protein VKJ04_07905 [Vampirovibrionales bacterium]|nr:hypothetical protein [Vampirovibrionales bacterium]